MLGSDYGVNASADEEVSLDPHSPRPAGRDQIVQDQVRHRLVEVTLVSEGPEIELERLELQAESTGISKEIS
jgi:hypothetical protein